MSVEPIQLGGIKAERTGTGRIKHSFRQSTLGDLDICAERGRRVMTATMPPDNKDASSVGTAVHAAIEYGLEAVKRGESAPPLAELVSVGLHEWEELQEAPGFERVKFKAEGRAEAFIANAIGRWRSSVALELRPIAIEETFKDVLIYRDNVRDIVLSGTIDLIDERWGCVDWKTSSDERRYQEGYGGQAWEKKRWAIQPTVYTYAAHKLGFLSDQEQHPFTYFVFVVMPHNQVALQDLTVYRHKGDWAWLRQKVLGLAKLVEAELDEWPKNDNHALCSGTWCPAWDDCKGSNYQAGWPKPSRPN